MVDKLLDTLTNGQHSKARILQEQQKRREEEQLQKALQDEMIAKAQQAADEAEAEAAKDKVQQNLNETAALLSELSQTQNERLSQDLPPHLGAIPPPSNKETHLADQVSDSLMQMARQVHPKDVISTGAVRGALGITTYPVTKPQGNGGKSLAEKDDTPYSSGDDSDESDSEADDGNDPSGSEDNDGQESADGAQVPESMDDNSDVDCNTGFGDL